MSNFSFPPPRILKKYTPLIPNMPTLTPSWGFCIAKDPITLAIFSPRKYSSTLTYNISNLTNIFTGTILKVILK